MFSKTLFLVLVGLAIVLASPVSRDAVENSEIDKLPENPKVEVIEVEGEDAQKFFQKIQAKFDELFNAGFDVEKFQKIYEEIQEIFQQLKEQQLKKSGETEEEKRVRRSTEVDLPEENFKSIEIDEETAKKIALKIKEAIEAFFTKGPESQQFKKAVDEIKQLIEAVEATTEKRVRRSAEEEKAKEPKNGIDIIQIEGEEANKLFQELIDKYIQLADPRLSFDERKEIFKEVQEIMLKIREQKQDHNRVQRQLLKSVEKVGEEAVELFNEINNKVVQIIKDGMDSEKIVTIIKDIQKLVNGVFQQIFQSSKSVESNVSSSSTESAPSEKSVQSNESATVTESVPVEA